MRDKKHKVFRRAIPFAIGKRGVVRLAKLGAVLACILALAASNALAEAQEAASGKRTRQQLRNEMVARARRQSMYITSWNAFSKQFIDPPTFTLLPLPGAVEYRAVVKQGGTTVEVHSSNPVLDLSGIWPRLEAKRFEVTFEWLGESGKPVETVTSSRVKAPDWQGIKEPPADWASSADRNISFLIDAAENAPTTYREPGVPIWFWLCHGPGEDGKPPRRAVAFPCLHMPLYIGAFLAHAEANRPNAKDARRIAELCAAWLLKNRRPENGALPLFPFTAIAEGKFIDSSAETDSVNLLRASHLGCGLVRLYESTRDERLLNYACHIADTTMRFQKADGSFPYRVKPLTGEVADEYTCHSIEFVMLVDAISPYRFDEARARAAKRALDWLLAYPFRTHHWQAGFEDVRKTEPYKNLENWSPLYLIRHLCRHKDDDPSYLPAARKLNRWGEDQFVAFGPDEAIEVNCPTPLVMEQYVCYWPMEVHTGNWILALMELHRATGEKVYLEKAMAAANAIVRSQYENGEFSTWGVDIKTGKPPLFKANWYGCNALATDALYKLDAYVNSLEKTQ